MKRCREEKKRIRKEWKRAKKNPATSVAELKALLALRNRVVRLHNRLRMLEVKDEAAAVSAREQKEFKRDPVRYAKKLFVKETTKAQPTFGPDETTAFFTKTYADADRAHVYEMPSELATQRPPCPTENNGFEERDPDEDELMQVLKTKRNGSAPGLSALSYLVWKRLSFFVNDSSSFSCGCGGKARFLGAGRGPWWCYWQKRRMSLRRS